MIEESSPVAKAVEQLGGVQKAAKAIGSSRQAIYLWLEGGTKISPEFAKALEVATDGAVTRADLRPDIYERAV